MPTRAATLILYGLATVGAVAASGLVALAARSANPIHATDSRSGEAETPPEIRALGTVVAMYAADNGGRIPAFRSSSPPEWWSEYAKGSDPANGRRIRVKERFVGRRLEDTARLSDLFETY